MARDGASGGVVRTVTVSYLYFYANLHAQFPSEILKHSNHLNWLGVSLVVLRYVGFDPYI
jgi:hypothetical protein